MTQLWLMVLVEISPAAVRLTANAARNKIKILTAKCLGRNA
ncbi:MAG: hypothetical protein WCK15_08685 [Pirellula sp.]